MKLTQLKTFYFSILVSDGDLNKIVNFLKSKYGDISIATYCNDGTTIETKEIDEIISFENANFRMIEALLIKASNSPDYLTRIGFSSQKPESSELYIVSNSDEQGRYIYQEVFQRIKGMRQWYDLITQTPSFIWILIPLIIFNIYYGDKALIEPISLNSYINLLLLLAMLLLSLSYPFERLKGYLFPKVFFLIGKQKVVMERIKSLRNFIFITVISSILIGIFVNWIS